MTALPALATIALGLLVVGLLTAVTGYFVAQEFGFTAVDRARLQARAAAGEPSATRALAITRRTSFMLSGAQLGITVTGLLVGYLAEPLIGAGIGELLGGVGVPVPVGIGVGTVLALSLATVAQMVFGELFPKNLAIARPEPVARRLAWSTAVYLAVFGWLIRLFDSASNLLLKIVRIEPAHDLEHAATPRDLEYIVAESRDSGDLPAELSTLLERMLDLHERTAEHAMTPRPQVRLVTGEEPVGRAAEAMARGHSQLPVLNAALEEVLGVIRLRDVLALSRTERNTLRARDLARTALMVPESLPLTEVLERLRSTREEFACVIDEYGGLAGVITVEDIAEELVGEITDEHDPASPDVVTVGDDGWTLSGAVHIDEVERLLGHDLPEGDYETIAGLVIARLQRLPVPGEVLVVALPTPAGADEDEPRYRLRVTVREVHRHVPARVSLSLLAAAPEAGR